MVMLKPSLRRSLYHPPTRGSLPSLSDVPTFAPAPPPPGDGAGGNPSVDPQQTTLLEVAARITEQPVALAGAAGVQVQASDSSEVGSGSESSQSTASKRPASSDPARRGRSKKTHH
ncbi:hypothetical protein F0562_025990 [Nyssa sinensis]|uniref:Uncharacterized protein n=1 Tax=Nyssa sinensis TaxID=561372 RepID=A0A5J5B9L4_9ASTE|nr:hypothetical protein F0562_025990 [Nyssa sinensis]